MPFDAKNDPRAGLSGADSFGRKGAVVTPSDTVDISPTYAKTIVVLTAGNVSVLPVENDDASPIPFTDLSAGQLIPFQVRRVFATGTTATVAAIFG